MTEFRRILRPIVRDVVAFNWSGQRKMPASPKRLGPTDDVPPVKPIPARSWKRLRAPAAAVSVLKLERVGRARPASAVAARGSNSALSGLATNADDSSSSSSAAIEQRRLNRAAAALANHSKVVHASYQNNVKNVFDHFEEIIKKLRYKYKQQQHNKGRRSRPTDQTQHGVVPTAAGAKYTAKVLLEKKKAAFDAAMKHLVAARQLAEAAESKLKTRQAKMEAARAAMQRAFNAHKSAAAKFESSVQAADETSTVTMTTVQLKNEICMIRKMECLLARFNKDKIFGFCDAQNSYKLIVSKVPECGMPGSSVAIEPKDIDQFMGRVDETEGPTDGPTAPLTPSAGSWTVAMGKYCPGNGLRNKHEHTISRLKQQSRSKFIEACKTACEDEDACEGFVLLYRSNNKAKGPRACNLKTQCTIKHYARGDRDVYRYDKPETEMSPITMDDEDHDEDDSTQPESPAERKLEEAIEASE